MSSFSPSSLSDAQIKEKTAMLGAMLLAKGIKSSEDLVKTEEPCHCMPPKIVHALKTRKENVCARSCCVNSTAKNGVVVTRMHRRGKLCPILHSFEISYCSKECMAMDQLAEKMENPQFDGMYFTN
jgi:hypothetical protein